jgi:16S rRNA (adenine1518-N6/adenine1519-N6)-dimethyltransferase
LPYSISTIFIARILELENLPSEMLFMLQKEMGMRLAAKQGTKDYGSLSVRVQAFYEVEFLRKVSPKVFYPAPEVDSALLRFVRKPVLMPLEQRQIFVEIVQMAFSQRRKKMIKQLCRKFDREKILKAYELLGIEEGARAETVSVDTFVALSESLSK